VEGQSVSAHISGLEADSTYHYRIVASSTQGVSYGSDQTFITAPPTLSEVTPESGRTAGGTKVTITGTNFLGATSVRFGSHEATYTVLSETSISATSPAGYGTVNVTVTTPAGTSPVSTADQFTYLPGSVVAWGSNSSGELGDGNTNSASTPVEVLDLPEATELGTGSENGLALTSEGTVMAWGSNYYGELGNEAIGTGSSLTPIPVCAPGVALCPEGPYLHGVKSVSAGDGNSYALMEDGTVMAWGNNFDGELGIGSKSNTVRTPTPVCIVIESPCQPEHYLREVTAISAGGHDALALLKNGTVMASGLNSEGELGDGSGVGPEKCNDEYYACSRIPTPVENLDDVAAIADGVEGALALLDDGTVRAWGEGTLGELGDDSSQSTDSPVAVCASNSEKPPCQNELREVLAIAASWSDRYALLHNGTVAAWGANYEGELGQGSFNGPDVCATDAPCSTGPVIVKDLSNVVSIAAGPFDSSGFAELQSGAIMAWGGNNYGSLGDGNAMEPEAEAGRETARGEWNHPVHVCAVGFEAVCPEGPYLQGEVVSMAPGGDHVAVSLWASTKPRVVAVTPGAGSHHGGMTVRIIGERLTGAERVMFGATPATEVVVDSGREMTAVVPAGKGTVDVTVETPAGVSRIHRGDEFSYQSEPHLSGAQASQIGQQDATISVTAEPEASMLSDCRVEYGTPSEYGQSVACSSLPTGKFGPFPISAHLTGLTPATTYDYRLAATNEEGTSVSEESTFTTLPANPPSIQDGVATMIGQRTAVLNATVNPEGVPVQECYFEYGTAPTYGSRASCPSELGAGTSPIGVAVTATGLSPGTMYYFRLVAANLDGTAYGAQETFTTAPSVLPELGRCLSAGANTGSYTTESCTSLATGGSSGAFEWVPWPLAQDNVSFQGGKIVFENIATIPSPRKVQCSTLSFNGEYNGQQRMTGRLTLTGCTAEAGGFACHSEGAAAREIKTTQLNATLGVTKASKNNLKLGWEFQAASGDTIASFECATKLWALTGSFIAGVTQTDTMEASFKLSAHQQAGVPKLTGFVGEPPAALYLSFANESFPAGVQMKATLTGAERAEIKAVA
jgi:alpha-tubulin suppressor-like RCC1 family protein